MGKTAPRGDASSLAGEASPGVDGEATTIMIAAAMINEADLGSLCLVVAAGVVAVLLTDLVRRPRIPSIVAEIALGVLIGPSVLGIASRTNLVDIFARFGLSYLLFMAGYEVEPRRVEGQPIRLAGAGWAISVVVGLAIAGLLQATGLVLSALFVGLALATTALGPLLPILRDEGVLETRFGAFVLAVGTVGEFGPIVAVTVLLGARRPSANALLLILFAAAAVATAVLAARWHPPRVVRLIHETMQTSAQLAVRLSMLLLVALVLLAFALGLDALLGAFAAGMIVRLASGGPEAETVAVRLHTIGYGVFIPVFFVATGLSFDLGAIGHDLWILLAIPLLLVAMLVVRGLPVLLYRQRLSGLERRALVFFSATGLPMIVVITAIGLQEGQMRPRTAVALVAAGMVSVFVYPIIGLRFLHQAREEAPGGTSEQRNTNDTEAA
jgi:Kef-type K+ transport system membrane component KefB